MAYPMYGNDIPLYIIFQTESMMIKKNAGSVIYLSCGSKMTNRKATKMIVIPVKADVMYLTIL
jgi:hypothetical protein